MSIAELTMKAWAFWPFDHFLRSTFYMHDRLLSSRFRELFSNGCFDLRNINIHHQKLLYWSQKIVTNTLEDRMRQAAFQRIPECTSNDLWKARFLGFDLSNIDAGSF